MNAPTWLKNKHPTRFLTVSGEVEDKGEHRDQTGEATRPQDLQYRSSLNKSFAVLAYQRFVSGVLQSTRLKRNVKPAIRLVTNQKTRDPKSEVSETHLGVRHAIDLPSQNS